MLPWIFIHGYWLGEFSPLFGFAFNVAMDFHPWILVPRMVSGLSLTFPSMLPWIFIHGYGHTSLWQRKHDTASMLPWIFIHGYQGNHRRKRIKYWRLQCCHGFSSMDTQLMRVRGHPARACFNVAMDFHPWILEVLSTFFQVFEPASMLPWIFIHGYTHKRQQYDQFKPSASMLPWIFIHGYMLENGIPIVMLYVGLQCCHGFSSMDTGLNTVIIACV